MEWSGVNRVLLVGGSSRMPMVQRMLEQESGRKADRSLSLDEAVAHGAAIYAGILLGARGRLGGDGEDPQRQSAPARRAGQGTRRRVGNANAVMIPKNTLLPVTCRGRFWARIATIKARSGGQCQRRGDASGQPLDDRGPMHSSEICCPADGRDAGRGRIHLCRERPFSEVEARLSRT